MSEASRAIALQHAVAVHGQTGDTASVLEAAEAFHSFITGQEEAAPAKPAKPAAPAKPGKPAAPTKPTKPTAPPPDDDAPAESEVTQEEMGAAIEAMINGQMRPQAIALLKKYGATSVSKVKPEDRAAVKQEAEDALLSA